MKTYPNASNIFSQIEKAQKIALGLHVSPDADSVGSNLALLLVLKSLGKEVSLFSADSLPENNKFLKGIGEIIEKDLKDVDINKYDTFICLDAQGFHRLTRHVHPIPFENNLIVIDHHIKTSEEEINGIIDETIGSCSELLYHLFEQWQIEINPDIATSLLFGIIGDTGSFRYDSVNAETFKTAGELMEQGATLKSITFNMTQMVPYEGIKFWSKVWSEMELKEAGDKKFVFMAIPHHFYDQFNPEGMSTSFMNSIIGTDFGMYIAEETKGEIKGSLRSRTNIDVSLIAQKLGGGGHKQAAGFRVLLNDGETFDQKKKEILRIIGEVLNDKKEK